MDGPSWCRFAIKKPFAWVGWALLSWWRALFRLPKMMMEHRQLVADEHGNDLAREKQKPESSRVIQECFSVFHSGESERENSRSAFFSAGCEKHRL